MIDSIYLWIFVWISKRWFPSIVFSTNPDSGRTVAIHFFSEEEHAEQFIDLIKKHKLDHNLKEQK
mgnify:CR=1 FL=1